MGYRSDVRVVVYGNGRDADKYNALKLLMGTTFAPVMEMWGNRIATWHDINCVLEFRIYDVKWYATYSDVQAFLCMTEDLVRFGYNVETARIGEDDDDTDITREGDDIDHILSVTRCFNLAL